MIYSASLRKIVVLTLILGLGLLVVTRAIQRCYVANESFIVFDEVIDRAQLALQQQTGSIDQVMLNVGDERGEVYDFSVILRLIDLVHAIKDNGRGLDDFSPRRRKIDSNEVKTLLEALLREREALRNYIWHLKGHSKVGIPPRRYRALLYYTEVLDSMITELRELMHR